MWSRLWFENLMNITAVWILVQVFQDVCAPLSPERAPESMWHMLQSACSCLILTGNAKMFFSTSHPFSFPASGQEDFPCTARSPLLAIDHLFHFSLSRGCDSSRHVFSFTLPWWLIKSSTFSRRFSVCLGPSLWCSCSWLWLIFPGLSILPCCFLEIVFCTPVSAFHWQMNCKYLLPFYVWFIPMLDDVTDEKMLLFPNAAMKSFRDASCVL